VSGTRLQFPIFVAVTTLSEDTPRPQELLDAPLRTAVELRLDLDYGYERVLDDPGWFADFAAWMADDVSELAPPPLLIAACRRRQDGGQWDGDEQTRLEVLRRAGEVCDLLDVESGVTLDWPHDRTIRSLHDLAGIPADLAATARAIRAEGAAVVKLVGRAARLADNLRVRAVLKGSHGLACFLTGEAGVPSRILGAAWGSALVYASLSGVEHAPGMPGLERLAGLYRAAEIKPDWECFGVAGGAVRHSLSPALHNVALADGLHRAVYLPLHAESAGDLMAFAEKLPLTGASVTVPLKQEVTPFCAKLDDAARATGAVNTLVRSGPGWRGLNTDVEGFGDDLLATYGRSLWGRGALVLGAGGSARAVVHALRGHGADVYVWARKPEQASALCKDLGGTPVKNPADVGRRLDLLINATPCGMTGHDGPEMAVDFDAVRPMLAADGLVYDLVYEPDETPLLLAAAGAGAAAVNGLGMLQRQAGLQARAFGYRMDHDLPEPPKTRRHLWLIGYRGAGKSTLARALGVALNRRVVDTDAQIELRAGRSIPEIFEQDGEPAFRALEREALRKAARAHPDAVIATGGGAIENPANVRLMRDSGLVLWMDAPDELLVSRLEADPGARPTLTGAPVAEEIPVVLARRRPMYEAAAHVVVRVSGASPHAEARAVTEMLAGWGA
jgi:3-dehydroquinate dehydratase / shikimate dehydrogenase